MYGFLVQNRWVLALGVCNPAAIWQALCTGNIWWIGGMNNTVYVNGCKLKSNLFYIYIDRCIHTDKQIHDRVPQRHKERRVESWLAKWTAHGMLRSACVWGLQISDPITVTWPPPEVNFLVSIFPFFPPWVPPLFARCLHPRCLTTNWPPGRNTDL